MTRKKPDSLNDLLSELGRGLTRVATRPDANSYKAHEKQVLFHESLARHKLFIGGNRSGKTVVGVIEDIWWLAGTHPYRETPRPPIRGRLVCVDFPNGWEKVIKPTLMQWIPPSLLIDGSWNESFNKRTRTLTLANGSFLEIMSYDQELDAFAGASRHFTHFDEEPPSAIWTECRARLVDTKGSYWITMTPVEGMTWVFDRIYEPFQKEGLSTGFHVIEVDMTDNPYLSNAEIEDFLTGMDENEIKARKSGKFVQIGGLIFKQFTHEKHVIEPITSIPRNWRVYTSLDHGYNNPTAWLFHAVSPNGTVITFAEHYRREWTVSQHATAVKEIKRQFNIEPFMYVGDPAIRQRSGINGNSIQLEYNQNGIPVRPSNNDVQIGLNRMLNYQNQGKWFITENCRNLLWEMRRYRWKTRESKKLQEKHGSYDEPHKKDDHACDSSRYFFVCMPELAPTQVKIDYERQRAEIQAMLRGRTGYNPLAGRYDTFNSRVSEPPVKVSTDEFMGGEW